MFVHVTEFAVREDNPKRCAEHEEIARLKVEPDGARGSLGTRWVAGIHGHDGRRAMLAPRPHATVPGRRREVGQVRTQGGGVGIRDVGVTDAHLKYKIRTLC